MGLLDDLIRQLEEAGQQQKRTALPGQAPAREHPVDEAQRRAREMKRRAQEATAEREQEREADPGESRTRRTVPSEAPALAAVTTQRPHPLLARLRAPGGARDAVILSEILRPRFRRR